MGQFSWRKLAAQGHIRRYRCAPRDWKTVSSDLEDGAATLCRHGAAALASLRFYDVTRGEQAPRVARDRSRRLGLGASMRAAPHSGDARTCGRRGIREVVAADDPAPQLAQLQTGGRAHGHGRRYVATFWSRALRYGVPR